MDGLNPETVARVIADNVASAVEHQQRRGALHPPMREALVIELLRALLSVMPTQSGAALVKACNLSLGQFAGLQVTRPRVETVSMVDGPVTMRAG